MHAAGQKRLASTNTKIFPYFLAGSSIAVCWNLLVCLCVLKIAICDTDSLSERNCNCFEFITQSVIFKLYIAFLGHEIFAHKLEKLTKQQNTHFFFLLCPYRQIFCLSQLARHLLGAAHLVAERSARQPTWRRCVSASESTSRPAPTKIKMHKIGFYITYI